MPGPTSEIPPTPGYGEQFDALYRRELGFVWRMLRYHGVPEAGIEDAVQDVFMVVHRRWPDLDPDRAVRGWLFGIIRRVAANHRRSEGRYQRKLAAAPRLAPEARVSMEDRVASRVMLVWLEQALGQLDEKLATVFVLSDLEGLSGPEVATMLGTKLNTVYWRLRTARAQITAYIAAQNDEGEGQR